MQGISWFFRHSSAILGGTTWLSGPKNLLLFIITGSTYRDPGSCFTNNPNITGQYNPIPFMGASKNRYSTSKWMVKIRENPIKMDDLGGKPTIFGNHHISPLEKYRLKMVHFPYFPLYWLFNRDPYSHLLSIHCRMSSPIYIYTLNNQGPFFHCSLGSHTTTCGASTTPTTPTTCSTLHKKYKFSLLIATGLGTSGKGWVCWGAPLWCTPWWYTLPETRRKVSQTPKDRLRPQKWKRKWGRLWRCLLALPSFLVSVVGGKFMYPPEKTKPASWRIFSWNWKIIIFGIKILAIEKTEVIIWHRPNNAILYMCIVWSPPNGSHLVTAKAMLLR